MLKYLFSNFSVYFRTLEISSDLPQQSRCEVLAFKVMVSGQALVYLHLESPSYMDSIDSLGVKYQGRLILNLNWRPSWKFYTQFCSARWSLCLHCDFYSFLSKMN